MGLFSAPTPPAAPPPPPLPPAANPQTLASAEVQKTGQNKSKPGFGGTDLTSGDVTGGSKTPTAKAQLLGETAS
jgi:hypothetical protein